MKLSELMKEEEQLEEGFFRNLLAAALFTMGGVKGAQAQAIVPKTSDAAYQKYEETKSKIKAELAKIASENAFNELDNRSAGEAVLSAYTLLKSTSGLNNKQLAKKIERAIIEFRERGIQDTTIEAIGSSFKQDPTQAIKYIQSAISDNTGLYESKRLQQLAGILKS